jgi:hypothetical protein
MKEILSIKASLIEFHSAVERITPSQNASKIILKMPQFG